MEGARVYVASVTGRRLVTLPFNYDSYVSAALQKGEFGDSPLSKGASRVIHIVHKAIYKQ